MGHFLTFILYHPREQKYALKYPLRLEAVDAAWNAIETHHKRV